MSGVTIDDVPSLHAMRRVLAVLATPVLAAAWLPPVQASTAEAAGQPAVGVTDSHERHVAKVRATPRASAMGTRGQRLTVRPVRGLSSLGQTVKVSGRGFSELVGIYVGLCVMPRPGAKPTPCGGGADTDGSSQASAWISSNPPSYGANLAKPYKRGGRFTVRIKVSPRIGSVDCRVVRCAVVARADHMRSNDRSWDVAVPVSFR